MVLQVLQAMPPNGKKQIAYHLVLENVFEKLPRAKEHLKRKKCPIESRIAVLSPSAKSLLLKSLAGSKRKNGFGIGTGTQPGENRIIRAVLAIAINLKRERIIVVPGFKKSIIVFFTYGSVRHAARAYGRDGRKVEFFRAIKSLEIDRENRSRALKYIK